MALRNGKIGEPSVVTRTSFSLRNLIVERLVPTDVVGGEFGRDKAKLLVYIHLLALAGGLLLLLIDIGSHRHMVVTSLAFILCVGVMIYVLRRYGNVLLSGNLLVALIVVIELRGLLDSGGLYSDNLLWLLLAPVIAFLFTSRLWGAVWSAMLFAILAALFALEIDAVESYRYASLEFGARHHFVSYVGLFSGVLGVLLIFVRNNDETLLKLLRTTSELRAQQAQTAAQNAKLLRQEAELLHSNRDLELFAYVASHDLKEPLRMVNAYSQLIERRAAQHLPAREREYLAFVREGADRMQTMLDDLLNFSKLGRERAVDESVDLDRTLTLVRHNLSSRIRESGGSLTVAAMPTLIGKPTHFLQLFQNLIANAFKFGRDDVEPAVSVTCSISGGGRVEIAVIDNGIGMRADDIPQIFGVFQRLNARDEYEGSGIGLATVKRILDEIGATIEVESKVGVGSRFVMTFPAERIVLGD